MSITVATHPPTKVLYRHRWLGARMLGRRFEIRTHGAIHFPLQGPVILAANHVGILDGPLLSLCSPRPVHTLTKIELFRGWIGAALRVAGQIPVDRAHVDRAAINACLRVLADGHVVGVNPEGERGAGDFDTVRAGAAYLALVSGAPIVPVVLFGTRRPGDGANAVPPAGSIIDIVYGPPLAIEAHPWPRSKGLVEYERQLMHEHLRSHLERAKTTLERSLPGPIFGHGADPKRGQEVI